MAAFTVAALSLTAFLLLERHQRAPMLDLSLFRSPTYVGANVCQLFSSMAMFGVAFFMSIYLQRVLGYSPVKAGLAFVPMTLLIVFVAPFAGRLSDRIGSRRLMTIGLSLVGVALLFFSRLELTSSYWNLLPGFVLAGIGMPMSMASSAAAAMRAVSADKAGVGSAVLNSFRQVGGSLGLALMGAIVAVNAVAAGSAASYVNGLERALHVAAGIAFTGAIVAAVLVRPEDHFAGRRKRRARPRRREPAPGACPRRSGGARSSRPRFASSRRAATRARRPRRSRARPASASPCSTATSPRSGISGPRASMQPGKSSAAASTASSMRCSRPAASRSEAPDAPFAVAS